MPFMPIPPEKIEELKNKLESMYSFVTKTPDGDYLIDYDKCLHTTAYNIGYLYNELNGLIWRENLVLAEMESQLAMNKKAELERTKHNVKFTLDSPAELNTWINGTKTVSEQEAEVKKVKTTIQFLQNTLQHTSYFSTNIKNLLEIKKQQKEMSGR